MLAVAYDQVLWALNDWPAVSKANSKGMAMQLTMFMARPVIGAASWKNRGVASGDCGFRE